MINEYLKNIDLDTVSNQTLAFIGDSVYSMYIRVYLSSKEGLKINVLHSESIKYVSASAQSKIIDGLIDKLDDLEISIYKRGRNSSSNIVSRNVDVIEYRKATGFETLIGYLFCIGNNERLDYIIEESINIIEGV
jgi:ribonuclease III family protein